MQTSGLNFRLLEETVKNPLHPVVYATSGSIEFLNIYTEFIFSTNPGF